MASQDSLLLSTLGVWNNIARNADFTRRNRWGCAQVISPPSPLPKIPVARSIVIVTSGRAYDGADVDMCRAREPFDSAQGDAREGALILENSA